MTPLAVGDRPRRFDGASFDAEALAATKGSTTISVCLPARDEAATVGTIVEVLVGELVAGAGLVEEVLVVDDASRDATAAIAREAGAIVVPGPCSTHAAGKGACMAVALAESRGELVCFLDADVENFTAAFVAGLVGPLVQHRTLGFTKATYRRPFGGVEGEGGRVTELLAKPALEALVGDLARFTQPLAGEVAARREVLTGLVLPAGYGVDVGLLIDVARRIGLGAMAEVDLGVRVHRNRPLRELAPQARAVLGAILARSELVGGHTSREERPVHHPLDDVIAARRVAHPSHRPWGRWPQQQEERSS